MINESRWLNRDASRRYHYDLSRIFFAKCLITGLFAERERRVWLNIEAHDLRSWTTDKHHVVDDRPFGGGDGMVLKPEPIFAAVESLAGASGARQIPSGRARRPAFAAGSHASTQSLAAGFATVRTARFDLRPLRRR